jgi:hypothetical protein
MYEAGDEGLVDKVHNPTGLQQLAVSPFPIEHIHVNGTLTSQCIPNMYEGINIHQVCPYTRA